MPISTRARVRQLEKKMGAERAKATQESITDFIDDIKSKVFGPDEPENLVEDEPQGADPSIIEGFKRKMREWWNSVNVLRHTPTPSAELQREKQKLISRADTIRKYVSKIPGLDSVGLGELAVLPLIPIAIITGALALVAKWTTDYLVFTKRLAEYQALVEKGVDPGRASEITESIGAGKSIFNLGGVGKWLPIIAIAGVGAYFFFNKKRR